MSRSQAIKIVNKFAEKLKKENFEFQEMYLFGSSASDTAGKWSDIDVAVVSDRFKKDWNKNEDLLWKLSLDIDSRIEPLGFEIKDFQNPDNFFAREIQHSGVRIRVVK